MIKPKILVSKCLNSIPCRYSGDSSENKVIPTIKDHIELSHVCPEVGIGLSTPRKPIRIEKHGDDIILCESDSKYDYTKKMHDFSIEYVNNLKDIDGFILKSRSPSCGVKNVKLYNKDSKMSIATNHSGIFAQKVIESYSHLPIEDEGRLKNYSIRDNFLTKVFTIRSLKESKNLSEFNENNKMLLTSYDSELFEELTCNINNKEIYTDLFYEILSKPRDKKNKVESIEKVFDRYKSKLSLDEVKDFNMLINQYNENKIPFSALAIAIRMHALRFKDDYIINQTFFNPYPIELVNVSDSGKGRSL